jgi:hypothetical protein
MTASSLKRGILAGILGGVTVAVWFLILDLAAGEPFRTPAALGYALLFGGGGAARDRLAASGPQAIEITFRVVAAYTIVHFVLFAIAGFVFVWIADRVETRPSFLLVAVLALILLEAVAVVNFASGAQWNLGGTGIWAVFIANILAIAVMGWYVWRTHPRLRHEIASGHASQVRI